MRYKPKSVPALHIALGGLPGKMRVEADPDIGVSAMTVWRTSEGDGVARYFWSCILLHCMSLRFGETGKHFGRSEVFSVCRDSSRRNAVHGGNVSLGSTL
jgi:hypothetical protein